MTHLNGSPFIYIHTYIDIIYFSLYCYKYEIKAKSDSNCGQLYTCVHMYIYNINTFSVTTYNYGHFNLFSIPAIINENKSLKVLTRSFPCFSFYDWHTYSGGTNNSKLSKHSKFSYVILKEKYVGWLLYFGIKKQKQMLIIENRFMVFKIFPIKICGLLHAFEPIVEALLPLWLIDFLSGMTNCVGSNANKLFW